MTHWDCIIIGAGAAGLMCAAEAAKRGVNVLLLDHAKQAGKKILISGGGRCNFTNYNIEPSAYLSQNPHFCKSALSRYTQWDFIGLVSDYGIAYHEKTLGQLFCDDSAKEIVSMLMSECTKAGAKVQLRTAVQEVTYDAESSTYTVLTPNGKLECNKLVIASGGLSMPKLGATGFGYEIAQQFGLDVLPTRAGLVPFTLQPDEKSHFEPLSGVSVNARITTQDGTSFNENILFTHRGLSGPAVLQGSSYWAPGEDVSIDILPNESAIDFLLKAKTEQGDKSIKTVLATVLAKRVAELWLEYEKIEAKPLKQFSENQLEAIAQRLNAWTIKPSGTEGYRTAEVTLGGVNTNELSSKTMEAKKQPGLYFIGEVMDVTGWLGGYNFQWAWSSGWACAQAL
ncbi:NAD(P)/FAD-dependent oxidoreductase [Echinimonas agarilytica]|uniref:NAD(P)/FAD-dependent oxidoreductase n=1 Tax=Echinimonas agarilytica TaxID=1215918 RepID=A0AA41W798_9GAMM|nr:NAD(P)/FAD-dependent oxidoreductase [Echinimonas agarilytica]MCM2679738.1 NAD(P)/FAD-dependent oxidoreductase [Echinimonas agarilytica]